MIDFSKVKQIIIPEGKANKITRDSDGTVLWKSGPKNWLPLSTEADGKTIYNNGLGYKSGTRLNSSASEVTLAGYGVCGYIPAKAGDIVRIKGVTWNSSTQTGSYFWTFDSSFTRMKAARPITSSQDVIASVDVNGVLVVELVSYNTSVRYIRLSAYGLGADTIITVNEEIL